MVFVGFIGSFTILNFSLCLGHCRVTIGCNEVLFSFIINVHPVPTFKYFCTSTRYYLYVSCINLDSAFFKSS